MNENKKYVEREDEYDMDGYDFGKTKSVTCLEQRLVEPSLELRDQVQTMRQLITNIYRAIGRPVKEEENEDETVVSDSEWIEKANTLIEESKVVK